MPERIVILSADITTLDVDAIVNAANTSLLPGGGVCGAIHRAAGPRLAKACAAIGHCPTGDARIAPGFDLPARFVIHAVGPVWQGGSADEPDLLASAYLASLALAEANGCRSIAFPAISTGIYSYPAADAARIALSAVARHLSGSSTLDKVVLCCFGRESVNHHRMAFAEVTEPRAN